ncbi:MAG: TIGR02281 family clan AA aspartic protease, partial [Porticoccaceae bacterium]|nr:TIGR02281 family clan AA aspartic protease [Porticoccaceae bacterium]
MESPQRPPPGQNMGRGMMYAGWAVLLALLTWVFGNWEESRYNPNQNVTTTSSAGRVEVRLQRNSWGHYVANGTINSETVTYLLDTGATQVSVPGHLADRLKLKPGRSYKVSTANGTVWVKSTSIDKLTLGGIEMRDVRASINPHMEGDEILL